MTRAELENTTWAKNFKLEAPVSYAEAIKYALQEELEVYINKNHDLGFPVYAIIVAEDSKGFWMDATASKKAAISLCKEMGWKIVWN